MKKKILAFILTVVMVLALVPTAVFAADGDGGTGTTTSKTLTVDASATEVEGETYTTIQDALNYIHDQTYTTIYNALSGVTDVAGANEIDDSKFASWTIQVAAGTYDPFVIDFYQANITIEAKDENNKPTIATYSGTYNLTSSDVTFNSTGVMTYNVQENGYIKTIHIFGRNVTLKNLNITTGSDYPEGSAHKGAVVTYQGQLTPSTTGWYVLSPLTIEGCDFQGTYSFPYTSNVGSIALSLVNCNLTVKNCTFDGYRMAIYDEPSGVAAYYCRGVLIDSNTFTDCLMGLEIAMGEPTLTESTVYAGIESPEVGTVTVTNNTFVGSDEQLVINAVADFGNKHYLILDMHDNTFTNAFVGTVDVNSDEDEIVNDIIEKNTWDKYSFYVQADQYADSSNYLNYKFTALYSATEEYEDFGVTWAVNDSSIFASSNLLSSLVSWINAAGSTENPMTMYVETTDGHGEEVFTAAKDSIYLLRDGALKVTKSVNDYTEDKDSEGTTGYSITVTFDSSLTSDVISAHSTTYRIVDADGVITTTKTMLTLDESYSVTFTLKDGETAIFGNLPAGTIYAVSEVAGDYSTIYATSASGNIVSAEYAEVDITNIFGGEKVSEPGLDKVIVLKDGSEVDQDDVAAGDTVEYKLTSNVPSNLDEYIDYTGVGDNTNVVPLGTVKTTTTTDDEGNETTENVTYTLTFHDNMDSDLSYNKDAKVTLVTYELDDDGYVTTTVKDTVDVTSYAIVTTDTSDGCDFEVSIDLLKLYADAKIVEADFGSAEVIVTFSATLSEDASAGAYYNTAWVTYPEGKSEDDKVEVDTYGIKVFKYDQESATYETTEAENGNVTYTFVSATTGLEATFTVYSDGSCETPVGTITTDSTGYGTLEGLDLGTYYLKETTPPTGYVCSEDVIPVIVSVSTIDADGNDVEGTVDAETKLTSVTVANAKIPETGGAGTVIFTVVGAGIIAVAGVVLVVSRRKHEDEE